MSFGAVSQRQQELDRTLFIGMLKLADYWQECRHENKVFKPTEAVFAKLLGRSRRWVQYQKKAIRSNADTPLNIIKTKSRSGRPSKLTPAQIRSVTVNDANKRRRSLRKSSRRFGRNNRSNLTISHEWIRQLRIKNKLKAFHRTKAPMITELNTGHRIDISNYYHNLFQDPQSLITILPNMIFVDEFFIYSQRKLNNKNDIIWAKSLSDIPDFLKYKKILRSPICVGVCVAMSIWGVWYNIKEEGQSWNGDYFRSDIIPGIYDWIFNDKKAIPSPDDVTLQHDCCPGWRAGPTQKLLLDLFGINHFIPAKKNLDSDIPRWAGNSPDMNPVENFGEILMDQTEILIERTRTRPIDRKQLISIVERAIESVAQREELLSKLVYSFATRCKDVVENGGKPLKY